MIDKQKLCYEIVSEHLNRSTDKFIARYNSKAKECGFTVGQRVFLRKRSYKDCEKKKLGPLYVGPYRIMQKLPASKFLIRNIDTQVDLTVHSDQLKKVIEATSCEIGKRPTKKVNNTEEKKPDEVQDSTLDYFVLTDVPAQSRATIQEDAQRKGPYNLRRHLTYTGNFRR